MIKDININSSAALFLLIIATGSTWITKLHPPAERQANAFDSLPLESGMARLVYPSHFLEHIPRSEDDVQPAFVGRAR